MNTIYNKNMLNCVINFFFFYRKKIQIVLLPVLLFLSTSEPADFFSQDNHNNNLTLYFFNFLQLVIRTWWMPNLFSWEKHSWHLTYMVKQ